MPGTAEFDQALPKDVSGGISGLQQAEHRKTNNGLIRLASDQEVTRYIPEYRRNDNSHRIAAASMNSTKKSKGNNGYRIIIGNEVRSLIGCVYRDGCNLERRVERNDRFLCAVHGE